MNLNLKPKESVFYDEVSMGEVMFRFDPGDSRIHCTRNFYVWESGAEYNVARALKKCFGLRTAVATAFADNVTGDLMRECLLTGGVDLSHVIWRPFDGIGRNCRNGLVFTERGFGLRGALMVSDRANTAASQIQPGEFDWDYIFGKLGTRWFHTGGVFAALAPNTAEALVEAVKKAKEYGAVVSYDLNYRASLWNANGGLEACRAVNRSIAPYIDVMLGNEEDFTNCLGYYPKGTDENFLNLDSTGYHQMVEEIMHDFPNIQVIASTLRTVKTATVNDWKAICYADGKLYESIAFDNMEVFDRVGGGDGFASGFIYGLLSGFDLQTALNYGVAHGAHVQTTPGDTSMARRKEIENIVKGGGARVVR